MAKNLSSALFWLGIGIFVSAESLLKLKLGTLRQPGPGFFPFWGGFLLAALSLVLLVQARRERQPFGFGAIRWKALLFVAGMLLAYLLLLETLGFALVTLLFLLLLFWFGNMGWVKSAVCAAIAVSTAYALFKLWLQVQLPRGPLGF